VTILSTVTKNEQLGSSAVHSPITASLRLLQGGTEMTRRTYGSAHDAFAGAIGGIEAVIRVLLDNAGSPLFLSPRATFRKVTLPGYTDRSPRGSGGAPCRPSGCCQSLICLCRAAPIDLKHNP
jgi:hypothetical protein